MSSTTPTSETDETTPEAKPMNDRQKAFKRYKQGVAEGGKPFFPYGVYHDIIAAVLVMLTIIALSWVWFAQANCDSWVNVSCGVVATPAEQKQYHPGKPTKLVTDEKGVPKAGGREPILGPLYEEQADPGSTQYQPRPEWYFYFLFYLLIVFDKPNLLVLGTIGLPTIWLILLILWPFLDRKTERRPSRRPLAMTAMIATAVCLFSFTYLGSHHGKEEGPKGISAAQQKLPGYEILFEGAAKGRCTGCHVLGGAGGAVGPNLDKAGTYTGHDSLEWQIKHLLNPKSMTPNSAMPPKGGAVLSDEQVAQVSAFMLTLGKPEKATDPEITGASAADTEKYAGTGEDTKMSGEKSSDKEM